MKDGLRPGKFSPEAMRRPWRRAILLGATALVVLGAGDRPASLVGKWRLNVKESELLPGEEPPQELVMEVTLDDGGKFQWVATVKMSDGASGVTRFKGAIDGKAYPVEGRPGSTSSFSWTEDGALKQVSESVAGIAVETCTFSSGVSHAPARKMTCASRQTDSQGRTAAYTEVFDRL